MSFLRGIGAALWAEGLKIRRSRILWISVGFGVFLDVVMGFFMFILKNPEVARRYRLVAAKASIAGQADWPSFFGLLSQAAAVAGLVGFGFVASWVFGREHSDRTLKDLLSLPASRGSIVTAKLIATVSWCLGLSALVFAAGLGAGSLVGLGGSDPGVLGAGARTYAVSAALTVLLVTCVAFVASAARGFLPALGFVVLSVLLAQVVTVVGYGAYFPWAVPALRAGAAGPEAARLGAASYLTVCVTSIAGLAGTFAWWRYADHV
jgi:ABC-2 type transport system permease protein